MRFFRFPWFFRNFLFSHLTYKNFWRQPISAHAKPMFLKYRDLNSLKYECLELFNFEPPKFWLRPFARTFQFCWLRFISCQNQLFFPDQWEICVKKIQYKRAGVLKIRGKFSTHFDNFENMVFVAKESFFGILGFLILGENVNFPCVR